MKGMWVGYDVGCTMGLTLGHGAWQIDQPSNGSMWNSYSFQPVGQWMGYSFTDLGAEGCCRSLNALFFLQQIILIMLWQETICHQAYQQKKIKLFLLISCMPLGISALTLNIWVRHAEVMLNDYAFVRSNFQKPNWTHEFYKSQPSICETKWHWKHYFNEQLYNITLPSRLIKHTPITLN